MVTIAGSVGVLEVVVGRYGSVGSGGRQCWRWWWAV